MTPGPPVLTELCPKTGGAANNSASSLGFGEVNNKVGECNYGY